MNYSVVRGSQDYVYSTLVDRRHQDLTEKTIELAVHRGPVALSGWLPAVWEDGLVRSASPVTFSMPIGVYDVTVRLTDNPEKPKVRVGRITITN